MTLLGELYSNALGIKRDDAKAAEWYKQAADRGDREAMFALGMMRIAGRAGPANREEGARLLASSAKLGKAAAAYNLGLLYLEGQTFPQDVKRAAELFRQAADAGNPEAQYALATLYKEGRGVERISSRPHGSCVSQRWSIISMPRWNTLSHSITAPAHRKMCPPRLRC
jgi:TPR repeat protein